MDKRELIDDALSNYAGWFDEDEPNDAEVIAEIDEALASKNPLDYSVTTDALKEYGEYLTQSVAQGTQFKDQDAETLQQWGENIKTIKTLLNV